MSFLGDLFRLSPQRNEPKADSAPANPADDRFYQSQLDAGVSAAGTLVTPETAMKVSTVLACVRVLSQSLAMLDLSLFIIGPDGKKKAVEHPLWQILTSTPNDFQNAFTFKQTLMVHLAMRGNAYARIYTDANGIVTSLVPLMPDRMRVYRMADNSVQYDWRDPASNATVRLTQDEVFHIRGMSSDGYMGMSPIACARETIGGAMATQDYANRLWSNNARPGGVLTVTGKLSTEGKDRLRADWASRFTGQNSHRTAILEEGTKWDQTAMTPEDSQFLQTRDFQVTDICRIFGVPPHMAGQLDRATHSNIEHQGMEFVAMTLMPWLVAWEQAITTQLLLPDEQANMQVQFQTEVLLRGDLATRYTAYAIGRQWGWLSANMVLEAEGKDPVPGGDSFLVPMNMIDANAPSAPVQTPPADKPSPPPQKFPAKPGAPPSTTKGKPK